MILFIVIVALYVGIGLLDLHLYTKAPFPERTEIGQYYGSGFIAYFTLGRKK